MNEVDYTRDDYMDSTDPVGVNPHLEPDEDDLEEAARHRARLQDPEFDGSVYITDGFGNFWEERCDCGGTMHVVRPGKARCDTCDESGRGEKQ